MIEGGVINITGGDSKVALVYGQMNEPPGARARVALTGLTVAEYFRDQEGQDVLLFIDNIFRFTQVHILSRRICYNCVTFDRNQKSLGRFRSIRPFGSYPIRCRLPTNLGHRYGSNAGKNYHHQEGFHYLRPSHLCPSWWLDRSFPSHHFLSRKSYKIPILTIYWHSNPSWMPPLSCPVLSLNWVSTQLSIHSNPPPVLWIHTLSVMFTTIPLPPSRRSFKITNVRYYPFEQLIKPVFSSPRYHRYFGYGWIVSRRTFGCRSCP